MLVAGHTMEPGSFVLCAAWNPGVNSHLLATAGTDGVLTLWDTNTGGVLHTVTRERGKFCSSCCFLSGLFAVFSMYCICVMWSFALQLQ